MITFSFIKMQTNFQYNQIYSLALQCSAFLEALRVLFVLFQKGSCQMSNVGMNERVWVGGSKQRKTNEDIVERKNVFGKRHKERGGELNFDQQWKEE